MLNGRFTLYSPKIILDNETSRLYNLEYEFQVYDFLNLVNKLIEIKK